MNPKNKDCAMFLPGLVSITFRRLSPGDVIALVARSGLAAIEWGGDIHVPHGETKQAKHVGRATRDAGLTVSSYGSYYRAGDSQGLAFEPVLETALALEAPLIRVWAGQKGSAAADEDYRLKVIEDAERIAGMALNAGLRVAFEFHANSLTDTTESALELLRRARHLFAYWQPPVKWPPGKQESSLAALLPHLAVLHVFNWSDNGTRRPLAEGQENWRRLLEIVIAGNPENPVPALIEFVRDDSPEAFLEDAAALLRLCEQNARIQGDE